MEQYFGHIKQNLKCVLGRDSDVRADAFHGGFTQDEFVDLIFITLTSMLLQGRERCGPLLEMASRCIYQ